VARQTVRLLLTCVGGALAWEMVGAFAKAESLKINLTGVDKNPEALGRHFLERFYPVPSGENPKYAEMLLDICEKEGIEVVVPGSDEEAFNLSRNEEMFRSKGIVCTVPRRELLDSFSDKYKMYQTLGTSGVPVPAYHRVACADDLLGLSAKMGYPRNPFILKPPSTRGGRGVWKISAKAAREPFFGRAEQVREATLEEMMGMLERLNPFPPLMAMEYLEGDFYDVDVLSDKGKSLYKVVRKRMNPLGIPFKGNVIEKNEAILELVEAIQGTLRLNYLLDIDIAYSSSCGAQLMEVNPRPSGSAVATVEAGLNLFEYLVRLAVGLDVPQREIPYGSVVLPKTVVFKA
jgi:carbamoyl-phosphate synthase large subunit